MDYKDIPGWFHQHTADTLTKLIQERGIKDVIEIGSFLGRSTVFFAQRVEKVYAVDPFVAWPEGRNNGDAVANGGEDFYEKFLTNTKGYTNIVPVRMSSFSAHDALPNGADLIYLDGAHDYDSVKLDISLWRTRSKKIICGDDHDENWPGVVQAVDEAFGSRVKLVGNFWYVIL